MNGKNHLVTGAALAVDGIAASAMLSDGVPQAAGLLRACLSPAAAYGGGPALVIAGCACAGLYMLGTVLPDIDNNGIVSKWLHFSLPFRHRGATHSIWAVLLFAGLSAAYSLPGAPAWLMGVLWPLRFTALGMLAHDIMDSLSSAGWAVFYPLGRWRVYEGIVMKRGWTPGLYSSKRPGSENIVAGLVVFASALCWGVLAYLKFFS